MVQNTNDEDGEGYDMKKYLDLYRNRNREAGDGRLIDPAMKLLEVRELDSQHSAKESADFPSTINAQVEHGIN